MLNNAKPNGCVDPCPPVRNRYFYGKLLDVAQFDLEQSYLNGKRWLLNRLVSGYGVICGLNVQLGPDNQSIVVTPGLAIDKCGREILVCQPSDPQPLPAPPPQPPPSPPSLASGSGSTAAGGAATVGPPAGQARSGQMPAMEGWECGQLVTVFLCYHECQTDPVPAMGGDCDTQSLCSPGAISERYRILISPGGLAPARTTSRLADVVVGGVLNYPALVNYVTSLSCQSPCPDCCIPLANVRIPDPGQPYDPKGIDITVRPLCYTNDLLYELILAMQPMQSQATAGKP
jgi:hypothetical protein